MAPLAQKEAAVFKEMFTLYEGQNYRRALKCADQILKKSPDHGGAPSPLFRSSLIRPQKQSA